MSGIKLTKLPARTPVRIAISVAPDLYRKLERYAECYRETYGQAEKVADLIPFMLEAFLASDKEFAKVHKATVQNNSSDGKQ